MPNSARPWSIACEHGRRQIERAERGLLAEPRFLDRRQGRIEGGGAGGQRRVDFGVLLGDSRSRRP